MAFVVFWWWSERMDKVFVLSLGIAACERSMKATHPGRVPLVPIATALEYGDGWPRRPAGQGRSTAARIAVCFRVKPAEKPLGGWSYADLSG